MSEMTAWEVAASLVETNNCKSCLYNHENGTVCALGAIGVAVGGSEFIEATQRVRTGEDGYQWLEDNPVSARMVSALAKVICEQHPEFAERIGCDDEHRLVFHFNDFAGVSAERMSMELNGVGVHSKDDLLAVFEKARVLDESMINLD